MQPATIEGKLGELSAHFFQRTADCQLFAGFAIKQKITAATSAKEFSADGAMLKCGLVQSIGGRAFGNSGIHPFLVHVRFVQHNTEAFQVPSEQCLFHLKDHLIEATHAINRFFAAFIEILDLVADQPQIGPDLAGVAKKQMGFQIVEHGRVDTQRRHHDTVFAKFEQVESAE
ncbi:MAG TPA: hypothetical protein VMT56_00060 [Candidatus Bathyarchaeia archaeon]|nr:hypothetical protein [Candidatus Bathyarchaeia archaeon]